MIGTGMLMLLLHRVIRKHGPMITMSMMMTMTEIESKEGKR
jgi:hypothetical protein